MEKPTFRQDYAPQRAYMFALQPDRCHAGAAPSIREAVTTYGLDQVIGLIDDYICNLMQYCMCRTLPPPAIRQEVAMTIITTYGRLKVTQLILFFVDCKAGKFGRFYQSLEPMDITTKLAEFYPRALERYNELAALAFDEYKRGLKDGEYPYDRDFCEAVSYYNAQGKMHIIFKEKRP